MKEYRVEVMETPTTKKTYTLYEGKFLIGTIDGNIVREILKRSKKEQIKIVSDGKLEAMVGTEEGDWRIERSLTPEEMRQLIKDVQSYKE